MRKVLKSNKKEHEYSKYRKLINLLLIVLLGVIIANLLIKYVVQGAVIIGTSMWPTYDDSDYVFVDKITWKLDPKYKIDRFDVIVCTSEYNDGELLIKRVIGLPGERVEVAFDGSIWINDEKVEDTWGYYSRQTNFLALDITRELGDGEYFVCGDNRNGSLDSRYDIIGNIKEENIIGKVINGK